MKVLVYGATGSQQFPVIAALQHKGVSVHAVTHSESGLQRLQNTGATPVLADMADAGRLREISKDMDAVSLLVPFFLSNPADGLQYAMNAIDAARDAGVKLLVWNTSGFLLPEKTGNIALDLRNDVRDYLQESGLPHIIIQPSVYAENLLGPWTAPFVKDQGKLAYPAPVDMPVGWIATGDVATIVAAAICSPHLAGRSFRISGLENLTGDQLALRFSTALGQDISYHHLPPQQFGAILDSLYGERAGKPAEEVYQRMAETREYPVTYAPETKEVLDLLQARFTSIQDWVTRHRSVFAGVN